MSMSMNNNEIISRALWDVLQEDISEYEKLPDHKFSHRFKSKMKKMISGYLSPVTEPSEKSIPLKRKIVLAFLVVILLLFMMGAVLTVYKLWSYYYFDNYGLYSILNIDSSSNFPTELEEQYAIGADMSEFTENILTDEYFNYWVEYRSPDGNITISFEQCVKDAVQNMLLNTENAVDEPTETEVNGHHGVFFQTRYNNMVLIWDVGDYIISLSTRGISKNELFSLAESVQKVE